MSDIMNQNEDKREEQPVIEKKKRNYVPILSLVIAILSVVLVAVTISYKTKLDALSAAKAEAITEQPSEKLEENQDEVDDNSEEEMETEEVIEDIDYAAAERPSFLSDSITLKKSDVVANTETYSVEPDLSNVYNKDLYWFDEDKLELLSKNLFYVNKPYGYYEFFEVYETNRYDFQSSFVTVDSLMHTYHLFFSHLMKNLEKSHMTELTKDMSIKLFNSSLKQLEALKGTEWEKAVSRNAQYFAIALALQGVNYSDYAKLDNDLIKVVEEELSKINAADGVDRCLITDGYEDYSQYIPRGYYEGDDALEQYFKTMMWYGRIQLNADSEDMIRSSILMNVALQDGGIEEWKDIYDVTAFFCGTSDDLGYYEYYPLIQAAYGKKQIEVNDLLDNTKAFKSFCSEVETLRLPEINSIPVEMFEDNVIPGFRLMGQRFTLDAAIFQNLIYRNVEKNSDGKLRMLPDVLDVCSALGSDTAYDLLKEQGDTDYKNYVENMDKLRSDLDKDKATDKLGTNLYGNWLNTLRPLLDRKGKGYPVFMQSDEWAKKDLETFAGSYTELKHDTVLYAKQSMAEMGSGEIPEYDDRGYVQPEPEVYARFMYLADATRAGLSDRNMISAKDEENLVKLSKLADSLFTISEKELRDEVLSDEEYDLIREYGGTLEHFWYDVMSADVADDDMINTEKYQAALVVDVATDPNGAVLEMATGQPCDIYVIVKVDGLVKIAHGSVYSFYQFPWAISDRLTDSKWRYNMGFEPGEDGFFNFEGKKQESPWWTKSYTYTYEY